MLRPVLLPPSLFSLDPFSVSSHRRYSPARHVYHVLTLAVCLLVCAILSAVPTDVAAPPPCSPSLALRLLTRPSSMTALAMSTNFSRPGESTRPLSCCASPARSSSAPATTTPR